MDGMTPLNDRQVPFGRRLTVRLTGGVTLVLLLIGIPFFIVFHNLFRNQQLESLAEATSGLSRVVVDALRSSMLAGEPHLLDETVRGLARQEGMERVLLLDHSGRVRVSSEPGHEGRILNREQEATCRVCHRAGGKPSESRTMVTEEDGRRIFRSMTTIPNGPACHGCHDPGVATNGILLMDLAVSAADRRFYAGITSMAALGTVMVLLTIVVLVLLLRRMVHKPLQAMVAASQRIVKGDLDARAEVVSSGEFSLLASCVNSMTDHLAQSLRMVDSQRSELQSILDAVDDQIVVLDRDQRIIAANKAFRAGQGDPLADFTGRDCREIVTDHQMCAAAQSGTCPVEKVFQSGHHHQGIVSHGLADGTERTVEIHASPLRGPDGEIRAAVEVRRDISERRQMEATLAHSEHLAALGLLASGISHEINNPLAAIATSVEGWRRRLATGPRSPEEVNRPLEQFLERIAREVERGRQITHRLLKVARPSVGARNVFEVNGVIRDIVAILAHDIARSGIETRLDLEDGLPSMLGDDSRLGQVVMNLALNAIQAMADGGGRLRIATAAVNGTIQIEVEDTGCGIPGALLKRIYEPFFTTKPVGQGTGLGLFISHRIVSDMGGTIQVRSQPERGTLFTVRIPRASGGGRT